MRRLQKQQTAIGKLAGPSPAESKYYVLVMFDISDPKKHRVVTKTLRRYAMRIQNSVYEAYLHDLDIQHLTADMERIMDSEKYFNARDRLRIYRMSGVCREAIYGPCPDDTLDLGDNIFF
jgi:CRISPR-associated endonuclease Cas2